MLFNFNGSFTKAKSKLLDQAIPIDLQLKLFDSLVEPILLYGAEVWGFENILLLERLHLQFCKKILQVRASTPNYMVCGELGRLPLSIKVKMRMVSYWCRLIRNENKISTHLYKLMYYLHNNGICNFKWLSCVKGIFDETGLSYTFSSQFPIDFSYLKPVLKQQLSDQFIQKWFSDIDNSSRDFYKLIKSEFKLEEYLLRLPLNNRIYLTKMRLSNIKLPVETGRWYNIPKENRRCNFCNQSVGDEFYILFNCSHNTILELRQNFIPVYYYNPATYYKMQGLFSICNTQLLVKISIFIRKLIQTM